MEIKPAPLYVHPHHLATTPVFSKPAVLGFFSLDGNRGYCNNDKNLSFLKLDYDKKVNLDLNNGYDVAVHRNYIETKKEKLNNLLEAILLCLPKLRNLSKSTQEMQSNLNVNFICFRGLLRLILATPYENYESWIVCATKFNGTIYLCAFDTEEKRQQELNKTEMEKRMCSWGYKFEQYMTRDDTTTPVNENEEFCCILKAQFGEYRLVYCAELDAADPNTYQEGYQNLDSFIELKTSKLVGNSYMYQHVPWYKLMKWWGQTYLSGIPYVICGFRTANGIVKRIDKYKVSDMPHLSQGRWNPNVALNFLKRFLDYVKQVVCIDNSAVVYKFEWNVGSDYVAYTRLQNDSGWCFLPLWFTQRI